MPTDHVEERFNDQFIFSEFDFPDSPEKNSIQLSTAYLRVFELDSRRVTNSVIAINNTDSGISIDLKIYGSALKAATIPDVNDDSWINILRVTGVDDGDPATYDHNRFKTIPALKRFYESFSNRWSFVQVLLKSQSGTPTIKCWSRSSN